MTLEKHYSDYSDYSDVPDGIFDDISLTDENIVAQESYSQVFSKTVSEEEIKAKIAEKIAKTEGKAFQAGSNKFDDRWVDPLVERIKQDKNLVTLRFESTGLTDEGVEKLASALANNKTITLLDLQRNSKVTDKGLMKVADMLAVNDKLEDVYLGQPNPNFTVKGVVYLAQKVVERERKYPSLRAEIDFSETKQSGDEVNLDRIFEDTLESERKKAGISFNSPTLSPTSY